MSRVRSMRRMTLWSALALVALLALSLYVGTQRPSAASERFANQLSDELAAGAPPASPPRKRVRPAATNPQPKAFAVAMARPGETALTPSKPAEPALGWGPWAQAPQLAAGPGGTVIAPNPNFKPHFKTTESAVNNRSGWHHGHFDGGTLQAHQHGNAFHKAHPHAGVR
jgi:hypothetical protein